MPEDQTGNVQEMGLENAVPPTEPELEDAAAGQVEESKLSVKEKALIKARDENARKAREASEEARRLADEKRRIEEENYLLKQQFTQKQVLEIDPDMPMTYGEYQKIEQRKHEEERKRQLTQQQINQQNKVLESVARVRDKYKDNEYSYDWALEYAKNHYSEDDLGAFLIMKNPAQSLYNQVMSEEENRDKLTAGIRKTAVEDTVSTLNKHLKQPGTLSNTSGANKVLDEIKQMDKIPGSEFVSQMDELIAKRNQS